MLPRSNQKAERKRTYFRCQKCGMRVRKTGRSLLIVEESDQGPIQYRFDEFFCSRCMYWQCNDGYSALVFPGTMEVAVQFLREVYEFEPNVRIDEWNDS